MALDHRCRRRSAFDNIRIQRSLDQEIHCADFFRFRLKDPNKFFPNNLAFALRFRYAGDSLQKTLGGIDMHQIDMKLVAESPNDLLRFIFAHEAVIDEYASQLVADRPMHQYRRHRRIDAARQTAQDFFIPNLLPNFRDRNIDKRTHIPVALTAANAKQEVFQQSRSFPRVHHFRVELHAVQTLAVIRHRRRRRIGRIGDHVKSGRRPNNRIAMTHPDRCRRSDPPEQGGFDINVQIGMSVFARFGTGNLTAQM